MGARGAIGFLSEGDFKSAEQCLEVGLSDGLDRQTRSYITFLFLRGKADEMLYEHHAIATGGLPFSELKQRSLINKRARAADKDPDFSRLIREELPGD